MIGDKQSVFIIAEAGVNHNGDLEIAKDLIEKAAKAGADAVKFQTFIPEKLVSRYAQKAEYQKVTTGQQDTQLEMLRKLQLKREYYEILKAEAEKRNILFISTPFDIDSVDFLESINMPLYKVPSGEITNLPYLIRIAKTGKTVIMSTGMSEMSEIEAAIHILRENGTFDISLLHCNTEYPTPYEDVNLAAMRTMREYFHCPVGYSDHTRGIEVPIAAVAMGAQIIEKHFTLDRNMEGPDHKASLEPDELDQMVRAIRNIECAIGTGKKVPSESEKKNMIIARKSIVAFKAIKKGEIFSEENITTKRPGNGISPMRWNEVLGMRAQQDFEEDELIKI